MKHKFLLKTMLLLCALIAGSSNVWADYETVATFASATVVTASAYDSYSNDDWNLTCGGNNISMGSNKNNSTTKCKITTSYGTGAKTSNIATAAISKNKLDKISQITFVHTAGSGNSGKIYFGYSTDGETWNAITLTSGTQGASTPSANTKMTVQFAEISSAYYAVILDKGDATSANFRFDNVTITFDKEAASADPSSSAAFGIKTPSISFPATTTYSQAPTTAAGYTGTISYEIMANTAGATIDPATGLVTVTTGGSVTVKATAAAVPGSFSSSNDSYTLTVNDTRTSAGLAWSAASANVTFEALDNVFPTLTNPHNVSVTYSSSNTSAATIDASGVITLKDVTANTTIKATFAGDMSYLPAEVTYTLNVTKAPFRVRDGVFDFVSAGAEDEDYGSEESPTSSSTYYNESETTWTAGNVKMVVSGKYRWWSKDMTLRLYNTNTSPASAATFSVPVGYVITKIETTGGSFVSASVGKIAAGTGTWTGFAQSVKLSISTSTVNFKTINVTYAPGTMVSDAGFTTYVTPEAIEFTGVTAYIATSVGTNVTLSSVASAPANTPVVIESSEGTYTFTSTATPASVSGNLLQASDGSVYGDGSTIYALGVGKTGANEGKVGFYLVGSGVQVPAGKAYLVVGAGAKEFLTFDFDDEATSIEETLSDSTLKGENIFNLAGQRIQKMQKGINIVNGKKILK